MVTIKNHQIQPQPTTGSKNWTARFLTSQKERHHVLPDGRTHHHLWTAAYTNQPESDRGSDPMPSSQEVEKSEKHIKPHYVDTISKVLTWENSTGQGIQLHQQVLCKEKKKKI